MADKNKKFQLSGKIISLTLIFSLLLSIFLYIFIPYELRFLKDLIVWAVFIILILIGVFIGLSLIKRYKQEDRGRLERLFENIAAGIVGAVLVTLLDKLNVYSVGLNSLSLGGIFQFGMGILYILGLVIFTLGVSLFPIWIILSYIEKD